jgi:hypothetical protein
MSVAIYCLPVSMCVCVFVPVAIYCLSVSMCVCVFVPVAKIATGTNTHTHIDRQTIYSNRDKDTHRDRQTIDSNRHTQIDIATNTHK